VGKIPFLYLGLSIGGDPRKLVFWEPVIHTIKTRLTRWQSRFLSFGGRLVLLKSVLTSLPVYALSFFKAPSGIISLIESLFNKFFWGGSEDNRKISWVAWGSICSQKECGGLGVRQLKEFNIALLGKWCWRMLVDRGGFWFRVLAARYGVEAGRLEVGGRSVSPWWREIARIRDGVGEIDGGWFEDRVSKVLGDGTSTLFWQDRWVGDVPLCRRFARLFDLSTNKFSTVAEMCALGWEVGGEAWSWRRRLWVWEEDMVEECRVFLAHVLVQPNVSDRWQWDPDIHDGYTVRGAYHVLTSMTPLHDDAAEHLVWHKQVPLKVSIVAWRLLKDRLPTKLNLQRRGIVQVADNLCISGCGNAESAVHLFLHCQVFGSLWNRIRSWIGVSGVDTNNIREHFHQFTHYLGLSKARRSFLQLLWLLCIWLVWNERNNRLFNNSEKSIEHLLDKVKFHSLWWLKANKTTFVYGSQNWWSNPLLCLGID
jgi:hypothetical protein